MEVKTKLSISAFIDLLGFSSHLMMANYDTRTAIGEMAVRRLQNLDAVLSFVDDEQKLYPECYPSIKIEKTRFNDAIFLTMELSEVIQTEVGDNVWRGWSPDKIHDWLKAEGKEKESTSAGKDELKIQSNNVAKFLGLVARMHAKINELEFKEHFPGARTVVSTGLKISGDSKSLDAFSGNFSLANAYQVGEMGKKEGFGGNNLYVEDNVGRIIKLNGLHNGLLYQSNMIVDYKEDNPYLKFDRMKHMTEVAAGTDKEYVEARTVNVQLFGKEYTFRALNINPLSWFQVRHYFEDVIGYDNVVGDNKRTIDLLREEPPLIEELKLKSPFDVPFLYTRVSMGDNYLQENFNE